ncbi:MAG: AAA family ATPase, partial [Deltaproteobacteria bacterium]|nr:AAA family ATPase [Deltaproteobacteria bacterium]
LNDKLNDDQKKAVRTILAAQDVCLIQGPPGTGKTISIAEAAYQFAEQGKKVLIASQSNLAVDNVLEKLTGDPAVRPIRLGKAGKISREAREFGEDQVLQYYYRTLAQAARKRYLDFWTDVESRIKHLESWIRESDFIVRDIREGMERSDDVSRRHETARRSRADEETRIRIAGEENARARMRRESLLSFAAFLRS